jgi:glycolate oxidase FAD binding subunit
VRVDYPSLVAAVDAMTNLVTRPLDIEAVDLEPAAAGASLWVRIGGREEQLAPRLDRLQALLGAGATLDGEAERSYWQDIGEFHWTDDSEVLVKTPLTAPQIVALDRSLADLAARRRYSVAGNVAWISLQAAGLAALEQALHAQRLAGLVVRGPAGRPLIGVRGGEPFYRRVKAALDPDKRFLDL